MVGGGGVVDFDHKRSLVWRASPFTVGSGKSAANVLLVVVKIKPHGSVWRENRNHFEQPRN